jgi:hypothetical protein
MSLRLWVRIRDHLWGWDDAFVLLAGVASIVGDSMVCLSECSISWFLHDFSLTNAQCRAMDWVYIFGHWALFVSSRTSR